MFDYTSLPDTFYRVSVKALIFDDQNRILVFQDKDGNWEMPGGGLSHGESPEEGLRRELHEEMRVAPKIIGETRFVYINRHPKGYMKLCAVFPVILEHDQFVPSADDLVAARFVSREEFEALGFQEEEAGILAKVDSIWPQ